jgi:myo-inositol-1(or 4)-monophosphatase
METTTNPQDLLDVAIAVARIAAAAAQEHRTHGVADLGTKTTSTDLVTAADRAVERLITAEILARRPHDQVLGEEYGQTTPDGTGVRWVVDPIDGTVNYVYGLPQYAVSIAAQVDGESLVGVVRNAVTGEEWTAIRDQGSWRDGRRLGGSVEVDLDHALVATGFGYAADRRAHQAEVMARVLPRVRDIRRFGAASLDLCFAAEGRVDAYFEKGLSAWDHAAGGLVARAAGLRVTGLRGAPPGPSMVLAAPEALYGPLHDLLVELDADGGP